jgi:hypothetical protein
MKRNGRRGMLIPTHANPRQPLATVAPDDLAALKAAVQALQAAQQAVADAQVELDHCGLTIRRKYNLPPAVRIDTATGDVVPAEG